MTSLGFIAGIKRELRQLSCRKIYIFGMVVVPVFMTVFFLSILNPGLPLKVPTAVVDLDSSPMSRGVTRSLNAVELLDISEHYDSFEAAMASVRRGDIYGFFVIPSDFERDALSGRTPTLEYYSDMTHFVPGTLTYKGFKTVAVGTAGGVVKSTMISLGIDPEKVGAILQPMVIDTHPLGNPWLSYAIYLGPSFSVATFALMIMLMTVYSITMEIKRGSSTEWLSVSKGRILVALCSKLLPHTLIYSAVGLFITWMFFGYAGFPQNGSLMWLVVAMFLLITASQALAVLFCSIFPNPRLALSLTSLFGILSFSFTGFSFPVESMYGALGVFNYLAPVRYYFLIYANEALNGLDLYYSRYYFAALLLFPVVSATLLQRLKNRCLDPVYVP